MDLTYLNLVDQSTTGDFIKGLTKIHADNIHSYSRSSLAAAQKPQIHYQFGWEHRMDD